MHKVSADTQGDLDVLTFCNEVIDKLVVILADDKKYSRISFASRDIGSNSNKEVPCWLLPVRIVVRGKVVLFDLVLAKKVGYEFASHIAMASKRDIIVLNILSNATALPNNKLIVKKLTTNHMLRRVLVHELVHYLVSRKFVSKKAYMDYARRTNSFSAKREDRDTVYYNEPTEMNTHYFEITHDAMQLKSEEPNDKRLSTFKAFLKHASSVHDGHFFKGLTEQNLRRVKKRLYGFWSALRNPTSSERYRRQMGVLATGNSMLVLSNVLRANGVEHTYVSTKQRGRSIARTEGFELFTKVKLNPKAHIKFSDVFREFCKKFKINSEAVDLPDDGVHHPYRYSFINNSGSIRLWTQFHPVYDRGELGSVCLKVEPKALFKFGVIRSALRSITNIKPVFTKVTKEDVYRELSLLLDGDIPKHPTATQEKTAYNSLIEKLQSGDKFKLEELQRDYDSN